MGMTDDAIRSLIRNTLAYDVVVHAIKNKLSFGHGLGDRSRAQVLPFFLFLPLFLHTQFPAVYILTSQVFMTGGTAIHRGDNTFLAHLESLLLSGLVYALAFFETPLSYSLTWQRK